MNEEQQVAEPIKPEPARKTRPGIRLIVDIAYPYPEPNTYPKGLISTVERVLDKCDITVVQVKLAAESPMLDPAEWGPE